MKTYAVICWDNRSRTRSMREFCSEHKIAPSGPCEFKTETGRYVFFTLYELEKRKEKFNGFRFQEYIDEVGLITEENKKFLKSFCY